MNPRLEPNFSPSRLPASPPPARKQRSDGSTQNGGKAYIRLLLKLRGGPKLRATLFRIRRRRRSEGFS